MELLNDCVQGDRGVYIFLKYHILPSPFFKIIFFPPSKYPIDFVECVYFPP